MGAGVPHGTATKAYPASSDKAGHAYTNNGPGDHPSKRPGTISPNWMQRRRHETGLEPEPPGARRTRDGQIGRGHAAHAERGGRATPMRVTLDATRPLASPPPLGARMREVPTSHPSGARGGWMRTPSTDRDAAITSWPPARLCCRQSIGADAQDGAASGLPAIHPAATSNRT